jgi:uncharacterized protein (TIGR02145 family)
MKKFYKNCLMVFSVISLSLLFNIAKAQHFNFEGGNAADPVWSLYIAEATLNGIDLEAGDEIAIFDGETMVGAYTLTQICTPDNWFENCLISFNTLTNGPGFTPGNTALFKCWDASLGIEISGFEISFDNPYGDAWTQDVFPVDDGEYSIVHLYFSWVQVGSLSGTVTNAANSEPIEGALVIVEGTSYSDITAPGGTYLIEDIEIGIYNVNVSATGYLPETITGVEVFAGETTTLDVEMNAIPGTIAGTVTNSETSETIVGATIIVDGTAYTATSNANGEYTIENVEPGIYSITGSADDYFQLTIDDQVVISNQTTAVDFALEPIIKTQTYNLVTGYQFVSSRLLMEDPDMQNILEGILDNLDFVRNSVGYMLRKIGPMWVNSIGDWVTTEGYLIKMNAPDSFEITGEEIIEWTPINLSTGYQIISYLPSEPRNCEEVFLNILDNLDFVRNTAGFMFRKIGPVWVNSIGNMQPGEGYLVKMNADDVLTYMPPFASCGDPFADPRDGQIYNTVQIGDQCWMAENLNIGTRINGNYNMADNSIIEKYCYDNDPTICKIYGGLYQWNEIMEYSTTPGVQGICPAGWHLPTHEEWTVLTDFLGGEGIAGGKMKETGTVHWSAPNSGATNESGFTALPGGFRLTGDSGGEGSSDNYFSNLTYYAIIWTSSASGSNSAWKRSLNWSSNEVSHGESDKNVGFSVRCIQVETLSKFSDHSPIQSTIHFKEKEGNPLEPVWSIYFEKGNLTQGDEIGVYNGEILTGAGIVISDNILENAIPVFSNLYKVGNKPKIKVWDESENKEYVLNDYTFSNPYGDAWTEDVFPEEDGEYSLLHFSASGISDENIINPSFLIYPNPSEGIFNISLKGVSGKVQIKVFDIHGNYHRFFEIEGTRNMITENLDLKELAAGVYFISFSGKGFNKVKKIVIQ